MLHLSQVTGNVLLDADLQAQIRVMTGWPMSIIVRKTYCNFLLRKTQDRGIDIHWGKKLLDVKQEVDKVTAIFEDGTSAEGDLLIGCDGLHSGVRNALFGEIPAEYTGLVEASLHLYFA